MAQRGIASFFKRPAGAPAAPEPAPAPAPKIQQASKNPAPVKAVVQPKRMRLITDDESDDEDQTSTLAEAALEASDAQDRAAADAAAAASAASAAPEVLGRGRSTRATRRRAVSDDEEEDQAAAPVKPTAAPALAQSSVLHDDAEQTPATEKDSSTPMEVEEPKALPASPAKPASSTGFAVAASKSNKAQSMMEFLGKKPAPAAAAAKSSSSKDKSTKSAPATKLSAAPNSHASKSTTAEASAATAMDTSDAAAPASSPRKDNPSAATVAAADEDQAAESLLDMDAQDMSQDAADPVPQELPKPTSFLFGGKQAAKEIVINYTPDAPGYHPIKDAFWKQDELVPYAALAKTFEAIGSTTKRLKIIETLANFFRSVIILSPNDLVRCVYMCTNRIAPPYEGLELGIGESLLMKAIADATGRDMRRIKADAEAKGDLGIVAKESRSSQKTMFAHKTLTVEAVFKNLREIASMTGHSVMSKKIVKIKAMLVACKESESMFLIRSLAGKLRIGLAEQSVLAALARAILLTPPRINPAKAQVVDASKSMSEADLAAELERATLAVKTVYCELPNYDVIIPTLLEVGLEELQVRCTLTPGIPLKPMLAHPTKGVSEVLKRFEGMTFTCEYKYDGERAQIHMKEDRVVNIYSRNSENNTSKYPDIIERIPKSLKDTVKSYILDCESVAWDTEKKQILPFQVLSTRKRKDADVAEIKVQVCLFAFDLLYLNGESLVKQPLKRRRELLREHFAEIEGEIMFATSMDGTNTEQIEEFLDQSIKAGCEGLMVKTLEQEATYEIAKRSHNWLKLKKDYLDGVGDTLDLVVIGGYRGKGKRTGFYGGFLLACYDEENEEYQSICKIGTGFSDEDLQRHSTFFKDHVISGPKSYYRADDTLAPDDWFDTVQVWEVKAADLSISPVHKAAAGLVDPEKGISLRFPRFLRIRDDKSTEQATNASQVADMYRSQQLLNQQGKGAEDEEDFY